MVNLDLSEVPITSSLPGSSEQLKPCCVCKESRRARDECMVKNFDGELVCKDLIEAHLTCMRAYGFELT